MRIKYKSKDELKLLRDAGLVVSEILDEVCAACEPGISTHELDQIAAAAIERTGVRSVFLNYAPGGAPPYPAVLCTSINEIIVHGIPSREDVLKKGDIIGIDFGIAKAGFCGDSARTVVVGGETSPERQRLVDITRQCLERAIEQCYPGKRLGDIGRREWILSGYGFRGPWCGPENARRSRRAEPRPPRNR
jgi:methionyl aminopeptidase